MRKAQAILVVVGYTHPMGKAAVITVGLFQPLGALRTRLGVLS